MSQLQDNPVLPVKPGLCAECRHASVKGTNRGTAYLRCTRAEWDNRLVRYPNLPVTRCVGFEPAEGAAEQPQDKGRPAGDEPGPVPPPRRHMPNPGGTSHP